MEIFFTSLRKSYRGGFHGGEHGLPLPGPPPASSPAASSCQPPSVGSPQPFRHPPSLFTSPVPYPNLPPSGSPRPHRPQPHGEEAEGRPAPPSLRRGASRSMQEAIPRRRWRLSSRWALRRGEAARHAMAAPAQHPWEPRSGLGAVVRPTEPPGSHIGCGKEASLRGDAFLIYFFIFFCITVTDFRPPSGGGRRVSSPPELKLGRGESILCPAARRRGCHRAGEGEPGAGRAGRSLARQEEKLLPPAAGQLRAKELLTGGGRGESCGCLSPRASCTQAALGRGWMEPEGAFLGAQLLLQGWRRPC